MALSSLLSPSCLSKLSWEAFLPNHGIFKALRKDFKLPSEEAYLGRNILVEKDGDLFLWDDDQKRIFAANLKNLKAKNERSSKLQVNKLSGIYYVIFVESPCLYHVGPVPKPTWTTPHSLSLLKVPISWLEILHIYNIWNPVIRIVIYIYLVIRKFYLYFNFMSTKITFSNNKIYCNSYHRVPNIINM